MYCFMYIHIKKVHYSLLPRSIQLSQFSNMFWLSNKFADIRLYWCYILMRHKINKTALQKVWILEIVFGIRYFSFKTFIVLLNITQYQISLEITKYKLFLASLYLIIIWLKLTCIYSLIYAFTYNVFGHARDLRDCIVATFKVHLNLL